MKTIKINEETHWLLSQIKANGKYKSFNELLQTELCMNQLFKGVLKQKYDKSKK